MSIANAWTDDYTRLSKRSVEKAERDRCRNIMMGSLQRHLNATIHFQKSDGFARMEKCRFALRVMDENGWKRSHHQRIFHESYIRACAKVCS
jgi:hypothetical protein